LQPLVLHTFLVAGHCKGHQSGRQPKTYVKPEAAVTVCELLMMGGVSLRFWLPATAKAIKAAGNQKRM